MWKNQHFSMHYLNLTLPAKFQTEDKAGSLHTISSKSVSLYANCESPGRDSMEHNWHQAEYGKKPLVEFVREIVGLDMNAAKNAFAE